MGAEQASNTLLGIQLRNRGEIPEEEKVALLDDIRARYEAATDPRYAASRHWVDGIIDPAHTRQVLSLCLSSCANNAQIETFKTGGEAIAGLVDHLDGVIQIFSSHHPQ